MNRWAYPALAFVTGAAVTVFEFAAPNLFRAYFGQTIYVWANVIGVILAALAVGYALGGRLADRTRSLLPLASVLTLAGLYGLLVGWFGPWVAGALAGPEEYTQETALRAFFVESLAASLVLFGPPLVCLGMATPLMVQRASADWPVGRAAGLVFGIGTFGSLAGIYLTTFVLVEHLGVRATITVAACTLLVLGGGGFLLASRRRVAALTVAPILLAPLGWSAPWADLPPAGSRLVLAIESPYQLVRVVDRPPGEEGHALRWLAFDEGMGTYHSMALEEDALWTGAYYDAFVRLPEWVGPRPEGTPLRICIVGNAAGTMSELLHRHHDPANLRIDGIEIDPAVTRASRIAMGLDESSQPGLRIHHVDGRTFLEGTPRGHYDAIVLDAYARQVSIPAALATREFFALARSRLREGGYCFLNLGALRPGSRLVEVVANTMAAGFQGPVFRCPLESQFNVLVVARRGLRAEPPPRDTPLQAAASFGLHRDTGFVLTDDFCPVESITADDLLLR